MVSRFVKVFSTFEDLTDRGTTVADGEVRVDLLARVRHRGGTQHRSANLFSLLQRSPFARFVGLPYAARSLSRARCLKGASNTTDTPVRLSFYEL